MVDSVSPYELTIGGPPAACQRTRSATRPASLPMTTRRSAAGSGRGRRSTSLAHCAQYGVGRLTTLTSWRSRKGSSSAGERTLSATKTAAPPVHQVGTASSSETSKAGAANCRTRSSAVSP